MEKVEYSSLGNIHEEFKGIKEENRYTLHLATDPFCYVETTVNSIEDAVAIYAALKMCFGVSDKTIEEPKPNMDTKTPTPSNSKPSYANKPKAEFEYGPEFGKCNSCGADNRYNKTTNKISCSKLCFKN